MTDERPPVSTGGDAGPSPGDSGAPRAAGTPRADVSRGNRRLAVILILLVVGVSVLVGLFADADGGPVVTGPDNVVGIIRVEGPIIGGASAEDLFGYSIGSDDIIDQLHQALDDPSVRAVVLRLNTPGGSAAAAQEIGIEIQRLREAGKVVVASMGDMAASGGYWIAAVSDLIVATPATITGSIGVIMELTNYEGLYEKLGISVEVIKSGEHKDIGSPVRQVTDEERRMLQALVDDIFDQFVTVVSEGRGMRRSQVLRIADGRIFTGRQAQEAGLVDELGTFTDAIQMAADMAGIGDDYVVEDLGWSNPWDLLLQRLGAGPAGWFRLGPQQLTWVRWILYPDGAR